MSLGPDSFRDSIKHSLAMGADEGVHINDPAVNDADHWATAEVLAAAIQKLGDVDLIIAGRQGVDWDMGVVGSTIAEILNMPVVTVAKDIQMDGGKVTAERVLLDGFETVEAPTPAVVTVSNELGEPRYPQLKQIMQAARKEVKAWTLADLGISAPQNRVTLEALFIPETKVETEVIEGETAQEKAQVLAQRLSDAKLI
jgi:electron transfer flavoprotein beta subunit